MAFVRTFFELNREPILFASGLGFFVVGLAIALHSRHYSRLDLARSVGWLAAFGFTQAFHIWGDLFIPIQAAYLPTGAIAGLHALHLILLGVSFACLFEFGLRALSPLGRARALRGVPGALLAIWLFVVFFPLRTWLPDVDTWHNTGNALARYLLGFPGALVAGYGLRQHTYHRIVPMGVPHIVGHLRLAGGTLLVFALFAGLVPPPVPFFPGSLVNTETFEQVLVVPLSLVLSLVGLALAVSVVRALEIFDLETERRIEEMEQQQILAAERERLARDLHDGAIQKVYTAGLLVESARNLAPAESPLRSRLERAVAVLNDAIADLRRNLQDLRPSPSAEPLAERLRRLAEDPRFRSFVEVDVDLALPGEESLSPVRAEHVVAVVQEALANAVRHARARKVRLEARREDGRLRVVVRDDGVGLPSETPAGYGLRNMRDRARLLGGSLQVEGRPGKGTTVILEVPWVDER